MSKKNDPMQQRRQADAGSPEPHLADERLLPHRAQSSLFPEIEQHEALLRIAKFLACGKPAEA